jgi:hypothetical protein
MDLPRDFLRYANFELAFTRIVRGGNKEYKSLYRHLFSSFNLALAENCGDLIDDLRRGTYAPEKPTIVYQPKKSGILRPLTLLSLRDLIVYQAIVNRIAIAFEQDQQKHAFKKSFGAIFAGSSSPFFYRSWKTSYRKYSRAITTAFDAGNDYLADFDLVSFYELIEHGLLAERLRKRVRSQPLIDLLLRCLKKWTSDRAGANVGHGVPQGPEPSAFLAECFLFHFDDKDYRTVEYFRYVDDIRLMAKDESLIRRALLKLDLQSKELGLVPQAQKIECRKVESVDEVLKNIPSAFAGSAAGDDSETKRPNQSDFIMTFRQSIRKQSKHWVVEDTTKFKFSLHRLNPRKDVLKRIAPFLNSRPDLSWVLASYLKKFPSSREAADILLEALKRDPTYDAAAANYIDAMDVCEPDNGNAHYRRVIETANRRSEEKSILLRIASSSFRGRRRSPGQALELIEREPDPRAQGILIHRLFGAHPSAPFNKSACRIFLESCTESSDPDIARFSAGLLLDDWPWLSPSWRPSKAANRSVALLLQGLGLRKRAPKKKGVLEHFFQGRYKIGISITWRKALGRDWREAERRCLRFQQLLIGDPTTRITLLDTFNELLLQGFSARHPALNAAYVKAAGPNSRFPDFGNWLTNGAFVAQLPKGSKWFSDIHNARVAGELAHAKAKKSGKPTRPISFKKAERLMKGAQAAWAELIGAWTKVV